MKRNLLLTLLIAFLFLASLSCKMLSGGGSGTSPTEASERPSIQVATATVGEEPVPTRAESVLEEEPEEQPAATSTPLPTGTPVPQVEALVVSDIWFAHDPETATYVWYAFFLENPNPELAVVDSSFQVVAYDSSGAVLGTTDLNVPILFAGEKLGLTQYAMNVPEGTIVEKVDILATREGKGEALDYPGNPLTVENSNFYHTQYRNLAAGMIHNQDEDESVTNVSVSVIAYDESGNVIGVGNNAYIPFVPANGGIGTVVDMFMFSSDIPARLEFYPTFSLGWEAFVVSEQRVMAEVIETGFHQDDYGSLSWGFVAQNPSAEEAIQYANFQATAFDENGNILATATGMVSLIFPGEKMGFAGIMSLPDEMKADKIEIAFAPQPKDQYDAWDLEDLELEANPLTAEAATYFDDPYSPKVTGIIKNSYGKEVNVEVSILLYDAEGAIVGGGNTYVSIAAKGQAAIEVYVRASGEPDQIVIYPCLANPPNQ